MSISTVVTAIIVIGIVWGGLTLFLIKASSYEKKKRLNGEEKN